MFSVYKVPVPEKDYYLEFCIDRREYSKESMCLEFVRVDDFHYMWDYECECIADENISMDVQVSIKKGFLRVNVSVSGSKNFTYVVESSDFLDSDIECVEGKNYISPVFCSPKDIACTGRCSFKKQCLPLKKSVMEDILSVLRF